MRYTDIESDNDSQQLTTNSHISITNKDIEFIFFVLKKLLSRISKLK